MKKITLKLQEAPITEQELNLFLEANNLNLPLSYKNFLLENNGGVPLENIYWNPEIETELSVSVFYALSHGEYPLQDRIARLHNDEYLSLDYFPFASNGGSGNYLISMREDNFGEIFIIYSNNKTPSKVCDSFDDFINALEE